MVTWVPLLAAITAAAAALLGYWLTNRSKQLDAKAKSYADALSAIEAYKSLPYRIQRRTSDAKDEADLQHLVGDVQQEIAFYRRWLALESTTVGLAYEMLANKVMRSGEEWRRRAWTQVPDSTTVSSAYKYDDHLEQDVCLSAMRRDLGRRRHLSQNRPSQLYSATSPIQPSNSRLRALDLRRCPRQSYVLPRRDKRRGPVPSLLSRAASAFQYREPHRCRSPVFGQYGAARLAPAR